VLHNGALFLIHIRYVETWKRKTFVETFIKISTGFAQQNSSSLIDSWNHLNFIKPYVYYTVSIKNVTISHSAKCDLVYSLLTFHAESYFCPFSRIDWFALYIWLDVFCRQSVFICSKYYRILNRRCPEEPPLISIWNGDLVYSV
jgi:hypothetical protein